MEAATKDNLERLITRADKYPQLKTQMQRHLEVSRRQKDEIEEQLKALGSDTSTLNDMAMRLAGRLEPLLSGVTADDIPKHCIAAHSWEQFEIGAYRSMLGAAEESGMSGLREMCERFIREEQEMANVFFEQLPGVRLADASPTCLGMRREKQAKDTADRSHGYKEIRHSPI